MPIVGDAGDQSRVGALPNKGHSNNTHFWYLDLRRAPRARIEAMRVMDMSSSNAWAEFSSVFRRTRAAYLEHENAKAELKALMPGTLRRQSGMALKIRRRRL